MPAVTERNGKANKNRNASKYSEANDLVVISGTVSRIIHPKNREAFKGFAVMECKDCSQNGSANSSQYGSANSSQSGSENASQDYDKNSLKDSFQGAITPIKLAGRAQFLPSVGDPIIANGKWEVTDYGKQLSITDLSIDRSLENGGLAAYIANNPAVKHIGPKKIQKIIDTYGDGNAILNAIKENAEGVSKCAGVKVDYIFSLADALSEDQKILSIKTWLAGLGLTNSQVNKIVNVYGWAADTIIENNPYRLIDDIDGWGFFSVDNYVAKRVGIKSDNENRLQSGIIYCMQSLFNGGDTYVEQSVLIREANKMLCLNTLDAEQRVKNALNALIENKKITVVDESEDENSFLSLPYLYHAETFICKQIAMHGCKENPYRDRLNKDLPKFKEFFGKQKQKYLNDSQEKAFATALRGCITIITGSAGTGKTFTIQAIGEAYKYAGLRVSCCAFAGKAARRITELTELNACTIHRLLEYNPHEQRFNRDADNPLETDVVIVDETSMIDTVLVKNLISAIDFKRTALIFVGDSNQLPPVGSGHFFRDVIASGCVPVVTLDTVVRQGGVLKRNANKILAGYVEPTWQSQNNGEANGQSQNNGDANKKNTETQSPWYIIDNSCLGRDASDADYVRQQLLNIIENRLDALQFDFYQDCQVLTPVNKRGPLSVNKLNSDIQRIVQKKYFDRDIPPRDIDDKTPIFDIVEQDDRIIQLKNNYDLQVFNGTLGVVREKLDKTKTLVVKFEDGQEHEIKGKALRDLSLAYCLTVHKAQGSEFPCVITVVHKSHYIMLHRNWLYTAVTRARKCSILIGNTKGMQVAVNNVNQSERKTIFEYLTIRKK